MNKIFEKISKDVLTDEVKEILSESFSEALTEQVELKVAEKEVELKADFETKLDEAKTELAETQEKEAEEFKTELVETISSYLESTIEEWMSESAGDKLEELEVSKAKAITEALAAVGVEIAVTNLDEKLSERAELSEELTDKVDTLVNEKIELSKEVLELKQEIVFDLVAEGLTDTQKEKLEALADSFLHITDINEFKEKLELIKSTIVEAFGKEDDKDDKDGKKKKKVGDKETDDEDDKDKGSVKESTSMNFF